VKIVGVHSTKSVNKSSLKCNVFAIYSSIKGGLSNEARQKLEDQKPTTVGQASRIPGITPATISILLVHLKKHRYQKAS